MLLDWPVSFDRWLDALESRASEGDSRAVRQLDLVMAELKRLADLDSAPTQDSADLKRVRQRGRYEIWRVSHPYVPGHAMRVICWFLPDGERVVVVAFAGDKAKSGDVFYDNISIKADACIDQYIRERSQQ
ncbi:MAG: hypothetical protein Q4G51_04505 [Dermatophilus congolensis]|nr:hypothetical protein [Dermatophilus congolensis]